MHDTTLVLKIVLSSIVENSSGVSGSEEDLTVTPSKISPFVWKID
jgi:hypothetical protein